MGNRNWLFDHYLISDHQHTWSLSVFSPYMVPISTLKLKLNILTKFLFWFCQSKDEFQLICVRNRSVMRRAQLVPIKRSNSCLNVLSPNDTLMLSGVLGFCIKIRYFLNKKLSLIFLNKKNPLQQCHIKVETSRFWQNWIESHNCGGIVQQMCITMDYFWLKCGNVFQDW